MAQAAKFNAPSSLPVPARFVAYDQVGAQPNIVVDGAPLQSTVLTLSHWPVNSTPSELKRDTSTETVFAYLEAPQFHRSTPMVTNNHFDEDGLCSAFALCEPRFAMMHRNLLVNTARAGDFGTSTDRDALRLFFLIEAFADASVSPLPRHVFSTDLKRRTAQLYGQLLRYLPRLVADLDSWSEHWRDGESFLNDSERLCSEHDVSIVEKPELDLAIVTIPENMPPRPLRRYISTEHAAVHPFAVHRRTRCNRMLWLQGSRYVFNFRYESWVQLASRRPALRVDMSGLIESLNAQESAPGRWTAEPVDAVSPRLYLEGSPRSTIDRDRFVELLVRHLRDAPVAWDPYGWKKPN